MEIMKIMKAISGCRCAVLWNFYPPSAWLRSAGWCLSAFKNGPFLNGGTASASLQAYSDYCCFILLKYTVSSNQSWTRIHCFTHQQFGWWAAPVLTSWQVRWETMGLWGWPGEWEDRGEPGESQCEWVSRSHWQLVWWIGGLVHSLAGCWVSSLQRDYQQHCSDIIIYYSNALLSFATINNQVT